MTVMVRSDAGRDALGGIWRQFAFIDPKQTIFNVQTLSNFQEF